MLKFSITEGKYAPSDNARQSLNPVRLKITSGTANEAGGNTQYCFRMSSSIRQKTGVRDQALYYYNLYVE